MTKFFPVAWLLAAPALINPVMAADEPLYVKNLSPVAGLFGLPSQRAAETASKGSLAVALHSSVASNYLLDSSASEYLNLDGESLRFALDFRYGLAQDWDVQLELPWLAQSGGHLDRAIDDWHDLWGMSDGGRSQVPRDLLDYRWVTFAGQRFALQDSSSGAGDISLALNHAFFHEEESVASIGVGYKFGVGDDGDFLGSGADDVFAVLRFSGAHLSQLPLRWHGQIGYLRAGDSDLLEGRQEQNLWFAGLSLNWLVSERWSLLAQLDSHAAPTNSDLTAIGDDAVMFTTGARWRFARRWSLDISVIEDIRVETAPDVTFQASLRYTGD